MRRLTFKEPNFKCKVRDFGGNVETRLEHADSEVELRQRLEQRSYDVQEITPYQFTTWKTKAETATEAALLAKKKGAQYEFARDIWSELKQYLFALANDKCAYCESNPLHVSSGDVEHYRPKKKVEEDKTHGGYYWLAYNIENFLPSCERCNRARGKMNQFPIGKKGKRAKKPKDDLKKEKALLLNPFLTDPARHLKFIIGDDRYPLGTVVGKTEMGKTSVRVYNLNRDGLVQARRTAISNLRLSLNASVISSPYMQKLIEDLRAGAREYSTTLMLTFIDWWNEEKAKVEQQLNG
jgi:hypothetical protein